MRHAHRIIATDMGRNAEAGPHEALLKNGELYAHLWRMHTAVSDTAEQVA